jgi:hypothetical protein
MFPSDETPAERSVRGRTAAHRMWAGTADRTARTANARAAFMARFELEDDPEQARKDYFADLVRRRRAKQAAAR